MNTLAKILSVNLLMCILVVTGQQSSFENINSKNAMAIVAQIQDNSISTKNYELTTVQYGTHNFAEIYANSTTNLSTLQLGDYNYLNFSSLSLGYDFKREQISKLKLRSLGLRFNMNDICRWSTIKEERGTSYPFSRSFSFSLNIGI